MLSPWRLRDVLEAYKRVYGSANYPKIFDHLRSQQQQIWASATATLTFDSIMVAATLVLRQNVAHPAIGMTIIVGLTLTAFLLSSASCVYAMNRHGDYSKVNTEADALTQFSAGVVSEATWCFLAMTIAGLATASFLYLVWTF